MSTLHLNIAVSTPGHLRTSWRRPGTDPLAFVDPAHFTRLARIAEDAKIDALFIGDSPALPADIGSAPGNALDPLLMLTHAAAHTSHIGVLATSTTTYSSPYELARRYLTIDHLTGGRSAFNAVTSYSADAAGNFGVSPLEKSARYARADEFVGLVLRLWESWDSDAVVGDRDSGLFADRTRIHDVDHVGEHFDVKGALPLPRSPQGRPVVVQAGASEGGRALGAKYADVVFAAAQTVDHAIAYRNEIRSRAEGFGRHADDVKLSQGLVVVVGETESDALHRELELRETIDYSSALRGLEAKLGAQPGSLDLDRVVELGQVSDPASSDAGGPAGFLLSARALIASEPVTARQLIDRSASGAGHRLAVGDPEQIANTIEEWFRAGAADGFTIMPADVHSDFELFAEHVVPLLIARGLFHAEYPSTTYRGNLGLTPLVSGNV
ncbi:NtaA/DmoA family FMN-dependent monooxygenase [Rhodococcoides kyotonense]|uniref:FMN-dependent oxidoreductase, nitrilotriacetate monooxygenase family n=1 Tax=Rhodococcoides kyotonense TaxID=398843 RepID=A0A239LIN4_9NOCA|nr:NtaA/DmoA family FMN-dependent monooxygenase [Rhodococcus kyotonensis]SNT30150.1 FMN-dependent oxidoreductase, nitrilotriacetate monooxygenase family [Rhodococcus kyotonensis]